MARCRECRRKIDRDEDGSGMPCICEEYEDMNERKVAEWCNTCGEEMPAERGQDGLYRCVECAEVVA